MADNAETHDDAVAGVTAHAAEPALPPSEVWRPKVNPWLIAVVVALAAFMEVLDTSIANVALPYIAGNLGPATTRALGCSLPIWSRMPSFCPSADGLPVYSGASGFS